MNIILAIIGLFLLDRVVMGRRWRQKGGQPAPPPSQPESIMLEHTITKHKSVVQSIVAAVYNPMQRPVATGQPCYITASKYIWPKERCAAYIKEMSEKGFVVGANIVTQYGNDGVISSIREIPDEGMNFFGESVPNIYSIHRPMLGNNGIWYNATEISIK